MNDYCVVACYLLRNKSILCVKNQLIQIDLDLLRFER